METVTYWWLMLTTWYHTNVGMGRYGYQVFNWWMVNAHFTTPSTVAYILECEVVFAIGPYHFLKRNTE